MGTVEESYRGFRWIKVPRYAMDESLTWEERYRQFEEHHVRETTFLIEEVRNLARKLDALLNQEGKIGDE
ncbi:MAG: hypothetical protein KDA68_08640 [Planctomycetaceae bacterium]|nr:hypothetical protein [Planctomycetaceae bacterium]